MAAALSSDDDDISGCGRPGPSKPKPPRIPKPVELNPYGDGPICGSPPKPWKIKEIQPEVFFYIMEDGNEKHILTLSVHSKNDKMLSTHFLRHVKSCHRILLITHGYLGSMRNEWMRELKDELLSVKKQIVGVVNWENGAKKGMLEHYKQAAMNALAVGEWLSEFIQELHRKLDDDVFLWGIGHSLGAHLMGNLGRHSKKPIKGTGRFIKMINRITGLDPAGPGFQTQVSRKYRSICKDDADMVDIIHTDGDVVPYYGTLLPMGTIDFYPCFGYSIRPEDNHSVAYEVFIWTIKNEGSLRSTEKLRFTPKVEAKLSGVDVTPCREISEGHRMAEMGYYADKYPNSCGMYYLPIGREEPFGGETGVGDRSDEERKAGSSSSEDSDDGGPMWSSGSSDDLENLTSGDMQQIQFELANPNPKKVLKFGKTSKRK